MFGGSEIICFLFSGINSLGDYFDLERRDPESAHMCDNEQVTLRDTAQATHGAGQKLIRPARIKFSRLEGNFDGRARGNGPRNA